jgi:hypothetical protein
MLRGPGRGPDSSRRDTDRPISWKDQAMSPGRLGGPDNSAQILRVLNSIQDDEECRLASTAGHRDNLLCLDVRKWPGLDNDPLVRQAHGQSIQIRPGSNLHDDSALRGKVFNGFGDPCAFRARQHNPPYLSPTRSQRFQGGVRARQDIVPGCRVWSMRLDLHSLTSVMAISGSVRASEDSDTTWVAVFVSSSRKPCRMRA